MLYFIAAWAFYAFAMGFVGQSVDDYNKTAEEKHKISFGWSVFFVIVSPLWLPFVVLFNIGVEVAKWGELP